MSSTVELAPVPAGDRRPTRRWAALLALGTASCALWWRARSGQAPRPPAPAPTAPPEPLPGRPRLVGVVGGQLRHGASIEPLEVLLHEGRQVLGRARDADVHLSDLSVSPRHALVTADAHGRVMLRDLGAVNGLVVDGIPVAEAELHDGNRLQIGDVQLIYRADPANDRGGRSGGELGEHVSF